MGKLTDWFFKLFIDGKDLDSSVYADLLSVEVEDNDQFADTFTIRIASVRTSNGDWKYFDDSRFELFNNVVIQVGFANGIKEYLVDGYITNTITRFDPEGQNSILELKGMDTTCILNLEERVFKWSNVSDAQIAKRIFDEYGFESQIEETGIEHREDQTIIMQRGTDIQLLRMLAKKNGFECFVEKDSISGKITGYFRKPVLDTTPQKMLSVLFGDESNVNRLDVFVDSLRPLTAQSKQINMAENISEDGNIKSSSLNKLGQKSLHELIIDKVSRLSHPSSEPSRVLISSVVQDTREIQNMCNSLMDEASWFVKALCEINGPAYQSVLRAKRLVLIRGTGKLHSGTYYVSKVIHIITKDKYIQRMEARRNAVFLLGSENFKDRGGFL